MTVREYLILSNKYKGDDMNRFPDFEVTVEVEGKEETFIYKDDGRIGGLGTLYGKETINPVKKEPTGILSTVQLPSKGLI